MKSRNCIPIGGTWVAVVLAIAFTSFTTVAYTQSSPPASSQTQPAKSADDSPIEEPPVSGQVMIDARGPIVTVYETVGAHGPEERAREISDRIIAVAQSPAGASASVRLEHHTGWTELLIGDEIMMAVTEGDAKLAGKPREQLAAEYAHNIEFAIRTYQKDHSWRVVLAGTLKSLVATIVLIGVLWLIRRVGTTAHNRIEKQIHSSANQETRTGWGAIMTYAGPLLLAIGTVIQWLLILGLVQSYITVILGFFSFTREVSLTVTKWVFLQLRTLGKQGLDYLPNLMVVAVVALITYYIFRLLRVFFGEIQSGNLKIRGFYPDWAEPTEKLVRMLVLVLVLIVCFPYLPGAKSPAFQGISIFLGVLLSLGSSSAVANTVAGVILTYMRSFLLGDWVEIGGTTGEVVEKNLLVTRVLTPKDEVITIPNATVMGVSVRNFSVEARKSGVIFHTTVTIGYDAPWRVVHQLLVNAALSTPHVLKQPAPFVLQSALNDFYVSYELNAYTDSPKQMLNIYSDLHRNIQDQFNAAGVEICSPHFSALRDGNANAVPAEYVKPGYQARSFRVDGSNNKDRESTRSNPPEVSQSRTAG